MWTQKRAGQSSLTRPDIAMTDAKNSDVLFSEQNLLSSIEAVLSGFETAFDGALHHRHLEVAGTTIDVASNDPDYLAQAARALATRAGTDGRRCKIAVISAQDHACKMPVWQSGAFSERNLEAILAGTPYRLHYYSDLNFWQIFDADRAVGIQWMATKDAYPRWDSGSTLRNFVQWHFGTDTASLLHGGTLALSGKGILLAGEGGAGKSSTVLAGIFGGLQSVGDDYVLVDAKTLTARPVFDTLKQDEAGLRRLGHWGHPAISLVPNWQGKHQFYLPEVAHDALPASITLQAIALPELTHGARTTVVPISAKEAFLALAPSGVSQIHCDRARLFAVAAQVSRQLPAYRLRLGTEPGEIVDAIRRFLKVL